MANRARTDITANTWAGSGLTPENSRRIAGMPRPLPVALWIALTAAALSARQSPSSPVVFHATVNYVEVDATVTDARGNAVHDLEAAAFEVLEDGQPQTLAPFGSVALPVQRALPSPLISNAVIEPDVRTNAAIEG